MLPGFNLVLRYENVAGEDRPESRQNRAATNYPQPSYTSNPIMRNMAKPGVVGCSTLSAMAS